MGLLSRESPVSPDEPAPHDGRPAGASAVNDLLVLCFDRIEAEGIGAVDAVCREHPHLAEALKERLNALGRAGLLPTVDGADHSFPERLGDFRLVQRLGGGGMGVVYEAEQVSLRRRVALKLIRPEQLYFSGARERFAREVALVARLSHPGITPVYTVGEHDGVPYFAMELVPGASLAEVISLLVGRDPARLRGADMHTALTSLIHRGAEEEKEELPSAFAGTWAQACAHVASQVAGALEHAHRHSVLHRDIKPSNIMLTPDGRALLVDFGLARGRGTDRLTHTGSQLGSAAYMAPEMARGSGSDATAAVDVYSLGVTLYELLTLRQPFFGADTAGTLRNVLDASPRRPRAVNRTIPVDLETVCSVAMDPDPTRRYRTAAAFARDLTNVLGLRPIEARSPGRLLRMRRWAQRNPARAVAVALAALLAIAGPVVAIQQSLARLRVEQALALAEENFDAANDAVEYMLTRTAKRDLRLVPQMEAVRLDLLERALLFYDGFLTQKGGDHALRRRTAQAWHNVAGIRRDMGKPAEAETAALEAIRRFEELIPLQPDSVDLHSYLSEGRNRLAALLARSGRIEEAEPLFASALLEIERAIALAPDEPRYRATRATQLLNTGVLMLQRRKPDAALPLLDRATEGAQQVVEMTGAASDRMRLAHCHETRGHALQALRRQPEAMATHRQAEAALAALVAENPADKAARFQLAITRNSVGFMLDSTRPGEGLALLREAEATLRTLVREFPGYAEYFGELGATLSNLAVATRRSGDFETAREYAEDAIGQTHIALQRLPDHRLYRRFLLNQYAGLCRVLTELGDHEELAQRAGEWAALPWCSPAIVADIARCFADCMRLVNEDATRPTDERAAANADYGRRGISLLERAAAAGFTEVDALNQPGFEPLRDVPGFADVVESMRKAP